MKNYNYRLRMKRITNATKTIGLMLLAVCCMPVLLAAENKPVKTHSVSGIVRDASTKQPISAAQIKTLNGDASASTNEDGHFSLKTNSKEAVLIVDVYNYNTREIALQSKDSVIIELYKNTFSNYSKSVEGVDGNLSNLVSVSALKSIGNNNRSTAVSVDEYIQGEAGADVRVVSRSAASGMGASLFIRGLNSLNANAQPLFIIDGVIINNLYDVTSIHKGFFSNPLANIDVNDIESISVLKDGTSVYGSKAANGVVIVKTKRGNSTVTKINLNVITGITTSPRSVPVMGNNDYKTYLTEILKTSGLTNNEVLQLPFLNDNPQRTTYKAYHNNTNWNDEVYQTGISKDYSISVNGGDEKALYYFTLGYMDNTGVIKKTDMQRYNMRLNGDVKLTDNISMAVNVGFSRIDRTMLDDGVDQYTSPTWLSLIKAPFLNPYNFTSQGTQTTDYTYADEFGIGNPVAVINKSINTMKQNSFNITLKPSIKINSALTLTEQFDYSLNKTNEDYYRPYLYTAPIFIEGYGYSQNARLSQVMRNVAIFSDTRLNFSKQFDSYNKLTAFLGTRYIENNFESDYAEGHNSGSNTTVNLLGSFKNLKTDGVNNMTKSLSNYLNADYSYNNKYFVNAAISMDASSRFGNKTEGGIQLFGQSWGIFPSMNGAWLMSSESFMRNIKAINLFKLRAGYGMTGNDDIQDYLTKVYFSSVRFRDIANGTILSNMANPAIQWETTGRANVGFDMGLFNDRLNVSLDVYSAATNNLLVLKQMNAIAGLKSYWSNGGQLTNKGIEFSANAKLLALRNFNWELGVNVGHYINNITKLPADIYSTTALANGGYTTQVFDGEILSAVGSAAGVFYGYKTQGVFATKEQAEQANLKIQNNDGSFSSFGAGDVIFEDVADKNGVKDGIINDQDKQIIGNPNPDIYGTITNKFSYKNISLTALFTYSYGNDIYNYQRSKIEAGSNYNNQSLAMLNRWTSEGQQTLQPKAVVGDPMGNARFSDRWIEDGSYLRLKTLTAAYDIPIKSNFIEGINIWISANNVFTLTKYLGTDPEFSVNNSVFFQGVDAGLLPMSRSYFIGLRLNL
jgi:TonB-linked SusC/RagA family outer membrane protein